MRQSLWLRWVIGGLLLAWCGCDVQVGDCRKDDAGECVDLFPDDDAGWSLDGGRVMDATSDALDGASGTVDAGDVDTGLVPEAGAPLSVDEFCRAQLAVAVAWRDLFDSAECGCARDDDEAELLARTNFLTAVLAYSGEDPEGTCIASRTAAIAGNVTYHPEHAAGCVQRFTSQFALPPAMCPVDIAMFESVIAHGAQVLVQLPECRAALAGEVPLGSPCSEPGFRGDRGLDCMPGLRCRSGPGGAAPTCQAPQSTPNESCERISDCADGHICSGVPGRTGLSCIPVNELRPPTAGCRYSFECERNYVCDDASDGQCVVPVPDLICGH